MGLPVTWASPATGSPPPVASATAAPVRASPVVAAPGGAPLVPASPIVASPGVASPDGASPSAAASCAFQEVFEGPVQVMSKEVNVVPMAGAAAVKSGADWLERDDKEGRKEEKGEEKEEDGEEKEEEREERWEKVKEKEEALGSYIQQIAALLAQQEEREEQEKLNRAEEEKFTRQVEERRRQLLAASQPKFWNFPGRREEGQDWKTKYISEDTVGPQFLWGLHGLAVSAVQAELDCVAGPTESRR